MKTPHPPGHSQIASMMSLEQEIRDLIESYEDLNGGGVLEVHEQPSALEFMRYVARNRPVVLRRGAQDWKAVQRWNLSYLDEMMAGQMVNVAMTPHGNADSVLEVEGGSTVFVKPYEREMEFAYVSKYIARQELGNDEGVICYCQTQNDNLRNEYQALFDDVPNSVPFARIALDRGPDAINFWLGNSRSTTALHKDPYENIYVQVLGQKHFVLLPPIASACVNDQTHPAATYRVAKTSSDNSIDNLGLEPVLDTPTSTTPFATWDPELPEQNATAFSSLLTPLKVTLNPGDMLYLPALWYHKVSQSCSAEGICCAVNYWYDMDYSGPFYPLTTFAKRIEELARRSTS